MPISAPQLRSGKTHQNLHRHRQTRPRRSDRLRWHRQGGMLRGLNPPVCRRQRPHWPPLADAYLNYKRHIQPHLEAGLLEMTIPEKPNSRLQKYRLTSKGRALVQRFVLVRTSCPRNAICLNPQVEWRKSGRSKVHTVGNQRPKAQEVVKSDTRIAPFANGKPNSELASGSLRKSLSLLSNDLLRGETGSRRSSSQTDDRA